MVGAIAADLSSIPSNAIVCAGSVYTVDPDTKGTNVRSAPDKKSPVLIVIPDYSEATVVDLSACSDDWVLINSAQGMTSGFGFRGKGWVHSSLFAVRAVRPTGRKIPLYSKPEKGKFGDRNSCWRYRSPAGRVQGGMDAGKDRKTDRVACTRRLLWQSDDHLSLKGKQ